MSNGAYYKPGQEEKDNEYKRNSKIIYILGIFLSICVVVLLYFGYKLSHERNTNNNVTSESTVTSISTSVVTPEAVPTATPSAQK